MNTTPEDQPVETVTTEIEPPPPERILSVITGIIHPNRLGWTFEDPIRYTFDDTACELFIRHGIFNIFISGTRPDDLATFLNNIHSMIQGSLDSLGFFMAAPLRGEVLSMVVNGNELLHRDLQWEQLIPEGSDKARVEAVTLEPFTRMAIEEPAVRLALADLRSALDSPGETIMLCFRAIESIRHWFLDGQADDDAARKRSWVELRTRLKIERAEIRLLEEMATARRHGADPVATAEQRLESLILARKVVERFVTYRLSHSKHLTDSTQEH